MSSSVRWVLWTPVVRGAQHAVVGEQPGRRAAVGGEAGLVLRGLLGEVDVQRGLARLGPLGDRAQLSGGDGPYGVDGRADPGVVAAP